MSKKIGLGILLAMMATAASASTSSCAQPQSFWEQLFSIFTKSSSCTGSGGGDVKHVSAPEIDPASAMAGLTLMVSGLAVLRGRRKSK